MSASSDSDPPARLADLELDASGLNCPLPILKAKKALASLQGSQLLRVIATDPGAVRDFEVFSQQAGQTLLESRATEGRFYFLLRKRSDEDLPPTHSLSGTPR